MKLAFGSQAVILASALILGGCAEYWAKPGGTPMDFAETKSGCESRSYQQFPPMPQLVMVSSGQTTSISNTKCSSSGSSSSCTTIGGHFSVPSFVTVDYNEDARATAVRACLFDSGWIPVQDRDEADAIFNSTLARPR